LDLQALIDEGSAESPVLDLILAISKLYMPSILACKPCSSDILLQCLVHLFKSKDSKVTEIVNIEQQIIHQAVAQVIDSDANLFNVSIVRFFVHSGEKELLDALLTHASSTNSCVESVACSLRIVQELCQGPFLFFVLMTWEKCT